ncbi:MAG: DNA-binding protein [Bacillota bacterium]|nr:DNA-binding protein [Bacillota bacterium]
MNKNDLTYAAFLNALQVIQAEGLTPSVRILRARVGGSNSTLVEYFRRWRGESETAKQIDENVSPALSDALKAEFGRIAQIVRADSAAQLSKAESEVREISDLLKESEYNLARSESQNQEMASHQLELEKKLAALEARLSYSKEEAARLTQRLSETADALVRSQAQVEQSSTALKTAEQKIAEQHREIESQRQARHETEVRVAVAESKLAEQKAKKQN